MVFVMFSVVVWEHLRKGNAALVMFKWHDVTERILAGGNHPIPEPVGLQWISLGAKCTTAPARQGLVSVLID